ncbi:hypothetical protein CP8484711_1979B, partial [Chlamydia psittaci 84-8471/1]
RKFYFLIDCQKFLLNKSSLLGSFYQQIIKIFFIKIRAFLYV